MSDDEEDEPQLPAIKPAAELSIFCRGCRHRLAHANSLRFLERDLGKAKLKLDLIIPHTSLKISQMLKVKDKVVYCVKCLAPVGKSGAPKGVPCRSIGFIDAARVYAVLGKNEIREDKWAGKAHRMMSSCIGPVTAEQLSSKMHSASGSVSFIPKYVPISGRDEKEDTQEGGEDSTQTKEGTTANTKDEATIQAEEPLPSSPPADVLSSPSSSRVPPPTPPSSPASSSASSTSSLPSPASLPADTLMAPPAKRPKPQVPTFS